MSIPHDITSIHQMRWLGNLLWQCFSQPAATGEYMMMPWGWCCGCDFVFHGRMIRSLCESSPSSLFNFVISGPHAENFRKQVTAGLSEAATISDRPGFGGQDPDSFSTDMPLMLWHILPHLVPWRPVTMEFCCLFAGTPLAVLF